MKVLTNNTPQIFDANECCVFKRTKEEYGGLSNMAGGFPLIINGIRIRSTEALYQACRFPHIPIVQEKIIDQRSPMFAKRVGKPYRDDSRPDWEETKIDIMYWCLRVKLAQNHEKFGELLESTGDRWIVEESRRDAFWGAKRDQKNENLLIGVNTLGQLFMKLRTIYYENPLSEEIKVVQPMSIPDFMLYREPIRESFNHKTLSSRVLG